MNTLAMGDEVRPKFNPFNPGEGPQWAANIARIWNSRDFDAMLSVLHPDCRVIYGDVRPFCGHQEIGRFLRSRFAEISKYDLTKTFRFATAPFVSLELDVKWSSAAEPDALKRTRAFEILEVDQDGLITVWELVGNPYPEGHA